MRGVRCVVIPSGARNLTIEAVVTLNTLCDAEPGGRSFASLRMTASQKNILEKSPKRRKFVFTRFRRSTTKHMKNIAPAISVPAGIGDRKPGNQAVLDWVHEVELLTQPENIFWCDGSDRENEFLTEESLKQNVLIKLNEKKVPRSYLHRSNPNDVARVEQFTFICTPTKEE